MFIIFVNFYRCFIQGFSRIAATLTFMLKTTGLFEDLAPKTFMTDNNEVVGGGGDGRANEMVRNLSKKLTCVPNIRATGKSNFLILDAKKAFNHLQLAFIGALILWYFDLEIYIRIQTDASGHAIGRGLSQLNLNFDAPLNNSNKSNLGLWHLVAYFSRKMIPVET